MWLGNSVSVEAVSRLNALMVLSVGLWGSLFSVFSDKYFTHKYCLGQLIGTSVGSILFVEHEWRASAAFGMAWYGLQIAVALVRGPNCKRREWVGY